jgi:hypothetical protein
MFNKDQWIAGLRQGLRFLIKLVAEHLLFKCIEHVFWWGWPYLVMAAVAIWSIL